MLKTLKPELFANEKFGVITVKDILGELEKPGRDPRPDFKVARFNDSVTDLKDLQPGMVLEGTVSNVAQFGAFVDLGVHQDGLVHVSQLAHKFVNDAREVVKTGDIVKVQCFGMRAPGRDIWSTASFNFQFANGMVGHLTSSYDIERGHPMERCEVAGVDGRFVLEDMWREVTLYPAGDPVKQVYTNPVFGGYRDFNDTFSNRIHCFLEQIQAGARPDEIDGSGYDGLMAQKVIQAGIESLETGKVVEVG